LAINLKTHTVITKKIADKNICGKYFCDQKMALFFMQEGHFLTANIITANIFIRKNLKLYGNWVGSRLKYFLFGQE
jgi:hypothetical protein